MAVKSVIENPNVLKELDLTQYRKELETTGQQHMTTIINLIIEEFEHPFKDPRPYRINGNENISS